MRAIAAVLVFFLLSVSFNVLACVNEFASMEIPSSPPAAHNVLRAYYRLRLNLPRDPLEIWREKLKVQSEKCASTGSMEACNDQAVALMFLGRSIDAIPLFEAIERRNPGMYQTAANLGTAFELVGQDDKALQWITEGIRRNPQSHGGTEWLHVRILQAKIEARRDSAWLASHAVLDGTADGPTGASAKPTWPKDGVKLPSGQPVSQQDVMKAIEYQLGERFKFVGPPEPIVGDLLMELASLVALDGNVESARLVLDLAKQYKPARTRQLAERDRYFEEWAASRDRIFKALYFLLAVSPAIGWYFWSNRARWRRPRAATTMSEST